MASLDVPDNPYMQAANGGVPTSNPIFSPMADQFDVAHRVNRTVMETFDLKPNSWIGIVWNFVFIILVQQFLQNQFFSGGLLLSGFACMYTLGKSWFDRVWMWILEKTATFTYSIEVDKNDEAFKHVLQWLGTRPEAKKVPRFSAQTVYEDDQYSSETKRTIALLPHMASLIVTVDGQWVRISREKADEQGGAGAGLLDTLRVRPESLFLQSRNKEAIQKILEWAVDTANKNEKDKMLVWTSGRYNEWVRQPPRPRRLLSSVILNDGVAEDLLADVKQFMASADWYAQLGIPYRRGYLLYGPPGNGKTSIVTALAAECHLPVYVINLSSKSMTDEVLCNLMAESHPSALLLLEDIDAAFVQREKSIEEGAGGSLTFSGLLNAIDGVVAQEGRLLIMTTNYPNRLDNALIRPGRVDKRIEINRPSRSQVQRMFKRFFADAPDEDMVHFTDELPEGDVSMAELQGFLLRHRDSKDDAIAAAPELAVASLAQRAKEKSHPDADSDDAKSLKSSKDDLAAPARAGDAPGTTDTGAGVAVPDAQAVPAEAEGAGQKDDTAAESSGPGRGAAECATCSQRTAPAVQGQGESTQGVGSCTTCARWPVGPVPVWAVALTMASMQADLATSVRTLVASLRKNGS